MREFTAKMTLPFAHITLRPNLANLLNYVLAVIAPLRPPGRASAERERTKFLGGRSLQFHSHSSTACAK